MRLILIICTSFLLAGCWQAVDITEIKKGEQFCADKMGIKKIVESFTGGTVIHCVNGEDTRDHDVTLSALDEGKE